MHVCVSAGYRNSGLTVGKKGNITLVNITENTINILKY